MSRCIMPDVRMVLSVLAGCRRLSESMGVRATWVKTRAAREPPSPEAGADSVMIDSRS